MWGMRTVTPPKFRRHCLDELHASHLGIVKTKSLARSLLWWPGLDKDIEHMIRHCPTCQSDADNPRRVSCLWPVPDKPWQIIHVDFAGLFRDKMFLVVVDAFSKWPEVVVMQSTMAENTVEKLRSIFANKGIPEVLVSDNGPQYVSGLFNDFMVQNGVKHLKSAPYHPATNGQAESFVKALKCVLRRGKGVSMQATIDVFLLHYRNAVNSSTSDTPAICLYGRALRSGLDLLRPRRSVSGAVSRPTLVRTFEVGQPVMVRDYFHNCKWVPAVVAVVLGPANYMVKTNDGKVWKQHVNQIHDRISASPPVPGTIELGHVGPPPPVSVESPMLDVPPPTGLGGSRRLSELVLNRQNAQAFLPGALDAKNVMRPTGMSPLPNQEESVAMSSS
uniref:Gypsy retrotransposon integrase-like protein 1 n=1 Tax=Eptatretus burgeri TaxID=7764 RepID=A0A8C4NCS6_EPTBU